MIVVMQADATRQQIEHVTTLIREMGLRDHVIQGTELQVTAVIGEDRRKDKGVLEQAPGVDRVMRVLAPYKLAAKEAQRQRTAVQIGQSCTVGGKSIAVMAGPCSVESREAPRCVSSRTRYSERVTDLERW